MSNYLKKTFKNRNICPYIVENERVEILTIRKKHKCPLHLVC